MDKIDTGFRHLDGDAAGKFQVNAAGQKLVGTQAEEYCRIIPHNLARAADDFQRETHAPFMGAAELVVTAVEQGGHELGDEIAVRAVDFDHVESGFLRPPRPVDKSVDQHADFVRVHDP